MRVLNIHLYPIISISYPFTARRPKQAPTPKTFGWFHGVIGLRWRSSELSALIGWPGVPDTAVVDSRNYSNLSFSASTLWDIDSQWNISLALSHSERAPVTQELHLSVKLQNISDAEIRESTSFLRNFAPQAGRSLEAGLRYSF